MVFFVLHTCECVFVLFYVWLFLPSKIKELMQAVYWWLLNFMFLSFYPNVQVFFSVCLSLSVSVSFSLSFSLFLCMVVVGVSVCFFPFSHIFLSDKASKLVQSGLALY